MRLENRVAVITGGGTGMGRASAKLFAKEGAKVVVAGRHLDSLKNTVSSIKSDGGDAIYVQTDVSNPEDVERMIKTAVEAYGKLNILYNNAGRQLVKSIEDTTPEEWDAVIRVNLRGAWLGCKYAVPEMKKVGGGSIISTSSIFAWVVDPGQSAYCPSKGGLYTLTKQLALELAPFGIRVNCICPGYIGTDYLERDFFDKQPDPEEARRKAAALHPIGRIGTPEDIAYGALYLASDESAFVTGHALTIDGGYTVV
ncbi:MAG: glucose 1-dehydrogenase [Chloroflexi bacterium]|nr:glucose 1-dehydrogenase [Chloroflexota bacterium]